MWGRKDPEQHLDAVPVETPRSAAPQPVERPKGEARGPGQSRIGESAKFKGDIHSDEDLLIDGQVEGEIDIPKHMLVIGTTSSVKANIQARSLVVQGELIGKVQVSERTQITATGRLNGDLVTGRIVIEDGGRLRGTSDVRPVKPASKPQPGQEKPAPPPQPTRAQPVQARPAVRAPEPVRQRPAEPPQRGDEIGSDRSSVAATL